MVGEDKTNIEIIRSSILLQKKWGKSPWITNLQIFNGLRPSSRWPQFSHKKILI